EVRNNETAEHGASLVVWAAQRVCRPQWLLCRGFRVGRSLTRRWISRRRLSGKPLDQVLLRQRLSVIRGHALDNSPRNPCRLVLVHAGARRRRRGNIARCLRVGGT